MDYPLIVWGGFFGAVIAMLALDLGLFHRKSKEVSLKEAAIWSVVWIALAFAFNGWVYYSYGTDKAIEFLTAYIVEKSLSVDNLFVFLAIFVAFGVRREYQHRVLFYGVLGAFLIRGVFITAGTIMLEYMTWIMYLFGAFLVYKGFLLWKTMDNEEQKGHDENWLVRTFVRFFPVTDKDHGEKFFVREKNDKTGKVRLVATSLFIVLLAAEFADLVFAIDSIPAIIGITQDRFILITSNVMALLGLRSLFFVLAAVNNMFRYLQHGMCLVLIFVGGKMVLHDFMHMPAVWSLAVIGTLIGGSILLSLFIPDRSKGS